jgi:hypothetical protein
MAPHLIAEGKDTDAGVAGALLPRLDPATSAAPGEQPSAAAIGLAPPARSRPRTIDPQSCWRSSSGEEHKHVECMPEWLPTFTFAQVRALSRATAKPGCVSERAVDENNGGISHL